MEKAAGNPKRLKQKYNIGLYVSLLHGLLKRKKLQTFRNMKKKQKMWIFSPPKPPKPKAPDLLQVQVQAQGDDLVERVLKPQHIQPPPKDHPFNYLVDIYTKWHRSYFYFCATYRGPGPNAISPSFEVRFARLEYTANNHFNLAYMRHTGQWWELYSNLSLNECLAAIRDEPHFLP